MPVFRAPIGLEARPEFVHKRTAGARPDGVPSVLKQLGAASQRLGLHELRIIMIPALFLPDVERTLGCVGLREIKIAHHKIQHRGLERVVQVRARVTPPRERQDLQRRSIVLRPRPLGEIEGSIWIDAGFTQHRLAEDRRQLVIGSYVLQERGLNLFPEAPPTSKLAPVQFAQRLMEVDKLTQTFDGGLLLKSLGWRYAQSVNDDRRVPEPVKEIVGVGIVSGRNRGGQNRSRPRDNALTKAWTFLDDVRRRDGAQHCAQGEVRFFINPVVERNHAIAETK